ncbi:MAG TPA: PQQ-dependent sugar dehydrogenase [Candidatus Acidoferrales bacterium]|nr:PQQ-dependent sugar dehydrogenase [Candidatus Acidoferrales bacterium]
MFVLALWGGCVFSLGATPWGITVRPSEGAFLNGTLPEVAPFISGNWSAIVAFTNLLFTNSVGLTSVPGTEQLCVWEREGRIWTFQNSPGAAGKKLVLDLGNQCQGWDDSGLLGVAFHPGFATNHFMFVYYTWVKPGTVAGSPTTRPVPNLPNTYHDRLERYTLDADGAAIPGSVKIFVDLTDQTVWHHGGGMFFHPKNGFLYWTDGDNSVGDNDQIINKSLYSGVFRIDVDCRGGSVSHAPPRQPTDGFTGNYFIPNDNPFVGQSNVLEEFFCLGLRSPHRMTYDPVSGRIFIGDVGESSREEVDVIEPGESGLNFQWNRCEGNLGKMEPPYIGISRGPVLDYPHTDGRAVIGGYVYRGKEFARDLGGKYIFGDNVFRTVWALDESTTPVKKTLLCVMPKGLGPNSGTDYTGLSSFGTDAEGEIYFCQMSSIGGRIYKLQRGGPPPPTKILPPLLSKTGLFRSLKDLQPADFLIPYAVNSPLWSDGAVKTRWFTVPAGSKIGFSAGGEWSFPAGSVFVKNFSLPVDDTDSMRLRRLETRLLVRDTNGYVYGATYKWRPDDSDAELVTNGLTEDIVIHTAGGQRTQHWFYPGRQDCLTCHSTASGGVLGVKTRQLNGDFAYPNGVTANQLRTLGHLGIFDAAFDGGKISQYPRLTSITNAHADLGLRVRSYLDANCSMCHRPGSAGAFFDARFDTPPGKQNIINGPVANQLGILGANPGAKVVAPADLKRSLLYYRISILGENQMPPLARNVVDTNAVAAVGQWIMSLHVPVPQLPAGWSSRDVGNVGLSGEADFLNGRFHLLASGGDIWESADSFHFASRPLAGDGVVVARVVSVEYTDPWAKAGIMLREDNSAGSKYVFLGFTGQGGTVLQSRPKVNSPTVSVDGPQAKPPRWLKLVRRGDVFSGFVSGDGKNWSAAGSVTNALQAKLSAGLAVTAHNNSLLNSTLFEDVSVQDSEDGKL